ncbi:MAG: hypothetical protein ACRCU3_11150 [Eubacteriaceae bacterium]
MRIHIVSEGKQLFIPLPNVLLVNRFSLKIALFYINQHTEIKISDEQLYLLCSQLNTAKKLLKGRPLVHIETKDGELVHITL